MPKSPSLFLEIFRTSVDMQARTAIMLHMSDTKVKKAVKQMDELMRTLRSIESSEVALKPFTTWRLGNVRYAIEKANALQESINNTI
jgi:AAA+ ATPase superfamily predicted ATPase